MNELDSIICRLENIDAGLSHNFTLHQHRLRLQEWANTVAYKGLLRGNPRLRDRFVNTLASYGVRH